MKILIAEDDTTSRKMLQGILSKWGYEVIPAREGQEAYNELQKENAPQLAILDWEMPEMDGLAVCRALRALEPRDSLYLILLTARRERGDIVRGLEAGADDYISKPYDSAELRARLEVGRRMIVLQNQMREREKLQGVLEMAGAVCHELNQPLQSVFGFSELLMAGLDSSDPNYEKLQYILEGVGRIGELTRSIMNITSYSSKPYLKSRIVDIKQASQNKMKEINYG